MSYLCGGVDEIRKSSSHEGYHIVAKQLGITYLESLEVRSMLDEDQTRLRYDEEKNAKPKQILWKSKKPEDTREMESEDLSRRNLLSLPFKSKLPRSVYVGVNK